MDKLIRRIRSIYAMVVFAISAVLFPIPLAMVYRCLWPNDERRKYQMHCHLCNYFRWVKKVLPAVTFRLNSSGEDFSQPSIIISNHQSHLDLLSILTLSPKIVAVTNQWVWNFPLYSPVIRYLEFYPAADGLDTGEVHIKSLLDRGYSVLIFPEGTRSADCHVHKFHRGAFYLAERIGADIVPIFLETPGKILPKEELCLYPGQINIHIKPRVKNGDESMGTNYREKSRSWHKYYLEWEAELNS